MSYQILIGDVREKLKELPDCSVQMCVTSPPYWGLRDYGTAKWSGGSPDCNHDQRRFPANGKQTTSIGSARDSLAGSQSCRKCGAIRIDNQIGLEKTPEEYVATMVEVFREVRRVLRDDGTMWLNIGDSYASGKGTCYNPGGGNGSLGKERKAAGAHPLDRGNKSTLEVSGLKPKDLVGIPWMTAFALRNDGWYLRSDIIWAKPNPMPESVTDRPTKSHEYLFLMSKSARYYYDADAIAEKGAQNKWGKYSNPKYGAGTNGKMQSAKDLTKAEYLERYEMVNKRSVWQVPTTPFKAAHFATFPPDLIIPCIRAGSKEGDTVIDPFAGSGTTCVVCERLGRNSVGIDLSEKYINDIAHPRIEGVNPLFTGLLAAVRPK